jgi:predicted ArsR family transcriptional regulator
MASLEVVAHPVRARILGFLGRRGTASLAELAEAAGVHRNTVRPHVGALEDAGVLVADAERPRGRGRPRLRYRLRGDWSPPTVDFRGLAELLAAALAHADADPERLDHVGRAWGRYLLGRPGGGRADREIPRALGQLGFTAEATDGAVELSACPCPLVAPRRPELICRLAAATLDGVLRGADDGRRVAARAHDHVRRRCTLTLGPAADAAGAAASA